MKNRLSVKFDTLKYILVIIFGVFVPYIGVPIILFFGYKISIRKKITILKKESRAVYNRDRRFKTGQRYEGHRTHFKREKVEVNELEQEYLKIKSRNYYKIGIGLAIFWVFMILFGQVSKIL